jgi:tetraacyldisaccharide 4'-kinase
MNSLLFFHRRLAVYGPSTLLEGLFFLCLFPFSVVYGCLGVVRGLCYDLKIFKSYRPTIPVISVGNIVAGGTGKTPVVDWLIKSFEKQGKKSAVISRGYGGSFSGAVGVVSRGAGVLLDATSSGDEPYLLAIKNPSTIILIARKRAEAVRIAVDDLGADVIILDDGFQHRAVCRDFDLVLLDASRPYANGWTLPGGLLREFPCSLRRADFLLLTRANVSESFSWRDKPVQKSRHCLADQAFDLLGDVIPLQALKGKKLCAFAGIADPQSFFSSLEKVGLSLTQTLSLGDHCSYDTAVIKSLAAVEGCDALITTEKDAVKLIPEMFSVPCYRVPMTIAVENEDALMEIISRKVWGN